MSFGALRLQSVHLLAPHHPHSLELNGLTNREYNNPSITFQT